MWQISLDDCQPDNHLEILTTIEAKYFSTFDCRRIGSVVSPNKSVLKSSDESEGIRVKSPIIGTAYLAPEPGAKKSIAVGDKIKKGDTIITINPGVGYEPYHIRANIDGRIQNLTFKNPGSVVKQGDALAILVPLDQKLIVIGQLQVKDRGYIEVGQIAKIKLKPVMKPSNKKILVSTPSSFPFI